MSPFPVTCSIGPGFQIIVSFGDILLDEVRRPPGAFRLGIPGEIIQLYGDWASDAYKSYLEMSMPAKLQLAYRMRNGLS